MDTKVPWVKYIPLNTMVPPQRRRLGTVHGDREG